MRQVSLDGDYCRRDNENSNVNSKIDVDLNRNFPYKFDYQSSPYSELYGGRFPLSESFSQCLDDQVSEVKPDIYLDIHTGEFSIYHNSPTPEEIQVLEAVKDVCQNCRLRGDDADGVAFSDMKIRRKL